MQLPPVCFQLQCTFGFPADLTTAERLLLTRSAGNPAWTFPPWICARAFSLSLCVISLISGAELNTSGFASRAAEICTACVYVPSDVLYNAAAIEQYKIEPGESRSMHSVQLYLVPYRRPLRRIAARIILLCSLLCPPAFAAFGTPLLLSVYLSHSPRDFIRRDACVRASTCCRCVYHRLEVCICVVPSFLYCIFREESRWRV